MDSRTVNVGVASAVTIPIPAGTVNAASKLASQEIKACYLNSASCDHTFTNTLTLEGNKALSTSGFITANAAQTEIYAYPVGPTHVGTWKVWVAQNTVSGGDPSYLAVTITVGCTITNVASPTAPSTAGGWTLTYNIFSDALVIDTSTILYPQTPLCGYPVT